MKAIVGSLALLAPFTPCLAGDYRAVDVPGGGVIRGAVTVGKPATGAKSAGGDGCPAEVPDESIQGEPGRLANAVVFIKKIKVGKAWAKEHALAIIDQRGCEYRPHVTLVGEGGAVRFLNSDAALHSVRLVSLKNPHPVQNIQAGESVELRFPSGHDIVGLSCPIHPFMAGHVVVMDHPYYALTGADGRFALSGVPPGRYQLAVWHPTLRDGEAAVAGERRAVSQGRIRGAVEVGARRVRSA